jgi:hypothetical protein
VGVRPEKIRGDPKPFQKGAAPPDVDGSILSLLIVCTIPPTDPVIISPRQYVKELNILADKCSQLKHVGKSQSENTMKKGHGTAIRRPVPENV